MRNRLILLFLVTSAIGMAALFASQDGLNPLNLAPGVANAQAKSEFLACPADGHHVQADDFENGAKIDLPAGERMVSYQFSHRETSTSARRRLCVETAKFEKGQTAEHHMETKTLGDGTKLSFIIAEHDLEKTVFRGSPSP